MSNYDSIKQLIDSYHRGDMSYDELVQRANPIIAEMNQKSKDIAKKYNMRARNVNLQSIMRNTY